MGLRQIITEDGLLSGQRVNTRTAHLPASIYDAQVRGAICEHKANFLDGLLRVLYRARQGLGENEV